MGSQKSFFFCFKKVKIRNIISRYNKNYFIRIKTEAERFHDHPQYEYTVLFTGEENLILYKPYMGSFSKNT